MTERKKQGLRFVEKYLSQTKALAHIQEQMFLNVSLQRTAKDTLGETDLRYVALCRAGRELVFQRACASGILTLIEDTVRRLPFPERRVLERYFLRGDRRGAAEDLMEELEFEKTHIYRLRDRGLEALGEIVMTEQLEHLTQMVEQPGLQQNTDQ